MAELSHQRDSLRQRLHERLSRCEEREKHLRATMDPVSSSSTTSSPTKSSQKSPVASNSVNKSSPTRKVDHVLSLNLSQCTVSPKSSTMPASEAVISDSARTRAAILDEKRRKQEELEKKKQQELEGCRINERLTALRQLQRRVISKSPKKPLPKPSLSIQTPTSSINLCGSFNSPRSPVTPQENYNRLAAVERQRRVALKKSKSKKASPEKPQEVNSSQSQRKSSKKMKEKLDPEFVNSVRSTLSELRSRKCHSKTRRMVPSLSQALLQIQFDSDDDRSELHVIPEKSSFNQKPEKMIESVQEEELNMEENSQESFNYNENLKSKDDVTSGVDWRQIVSDESVEDVFDDEEFNQSDRSSQSDSEAVTVSKKGSAVIKPTSPVKTHQSNLIELPTDPFEQSELLAVIAQGADLLKYSADGKAQKRFFVIVPEECTIYWGKSCTQKTLKTATITELMIGNPHGIFIPLCFTCKLLGGELLILATEDEESFEKWTKGIQLVLDHVSTLI
ncbi:hypothetical protein GEMRC1_001159 [Eukaryota sp. GEM-RC1]